MIDIPIRLPRDLLAKVIGWRRDAQSYGKRPSGTASFIRRFTGDYKGIAEEIVNQLNLVADQKKAKDRARNERTFINNKIRQAKEKEQTVSFRRNERGNIVVTRGAEGSAPSMETIEINTTAILIGALIIALVVI